MICPSCSYTNEDDGRYCVRCRTSFSSLNLGVAELKNHFQWILRRASAGFVAGLIAWFFIPVVTRILTQTNSALFIFVLSGLMGGAFLGCVDGMVEGSSPKTFRGAFMGGIGGALGGAVFVAMKNEIAPVHILWALFIYWAIPGAFIGMVSAYWEGDVKKWLVGLVSGFVGGGIGGYLGAAVHSNVVQQFDPQGWWIQRALEAMIGGFIGVSLWFCVGTAERFFIFKRRLLRHQDHKICDRCDTKNPLHSWYCGQCGRVLQVSAPLQKLNLSPYGTLNRLREMFQFLSRLAVATGFIAAFVACFIFLPGDPFVILLAFLLIALVCHGLHVLFSSVAESLQIFIEK